MVYTDEAMGEVGASNFPEHSATELLTSELKICQSEHASRGLVLRQTLEVRQSSIVQWVYSFSGGLGNIFINLDTGAVEEVEGALVAAAQEKLKSAEHFFRDGEFENAWMLAATASVMDGCKIEGEKLRKKIAEKIENYYFSRSVMTVIALAGIFAVPLGAFAKNWHPGSFDSVGLLWSLGFAMLLSWWHAKDGAIRLRKSQRRPAAFSIGTIGFFSGMPFFLGATNPALRLLTLIAFFFVFITRFKERSRRSGLSTSKVNGNNPVDLEKYIYELSEPSSTSLSLLSFSAMIMAVLGLLAVHFSLVGAR